MGIVHGQALLPATIFAICRLLILRGNWFWVLWFLIMPLILNIYEHILIVRPASSFIPLITLFITSI